MKTKQVKHELGLKSNVFHVYHHTFRV